MPSPQDTSMFEQYNQKARRVIFHARYECSTLGSPAIRSEHLLLGLIREDRRLPPLYLNLSASALEDHLRKIQAPGPKIATSTDLPLDDGGRRILGYAAEGAERLAHTFIGPEHLLLGIMREEKGAAAEALRKQGAPSVAEVRQAIANSALTEDGSANRGLSTSTSPSMRLIEQDSHREIQTRLPLVNVPRIGEAMLLTEADGDNGLYRIMDVRWHLRGQTNEQNARLYQVVIILRRETPGNA